MVDIKELHKLICDEKNEIIKKAELAKSMNYSREYVGQLFKNDKKQIALDKIDMPAVKTVLEAGRVRSLVKALIKSLNCDAEAAEALIGILKVPEIAKSFIE